MIELFKIKYDEIDKCVEDYKKWPNKKINTKIFTNKHLKTWELRDKYTDNVYGEDYGDGFVDSNGAVYNSWPAACIALGEENIQAANFSKDSELNSLSLLEKLKLNKVSGLTKDESNYLYSLILDSTTVSVQC